jgi:predicted DNA-binding protein YlxM (UPF0122 family)
LVLRFAEEMELPEIAKSMKVTESAVKVHLFRAVLSLRKTLRKNSCTSQCVRFLPYADLSSNSRERARGRRRN